MTWPTSLLNVPGGHAVSLPLVIPSSGQYLWAEDAGGRRSRQRLGARVSTKVVR